MFFVFYSLLDDTCVCMYGVMCYTLYITYLGNLYLNSQGAVFSEGYEILTVQSLNVMLDIGPKARVSHCFFAVLKNRYLGGDQEQWPWGTFEESPRRAQSYLICCVLITLLESWGGGTRGVSLTLTA